MAIHSLSVALEFTFINRRLLQVLCTIMEVLIQSLFKIYHY